MTTHLGVAVMASMWVPHLDGNLIGIQAFINSSLELLVIDNQLGRVCPSLNDHFLKRLFFHRELVAVDEPVVVCDRLCLIYRDVHSTFIGTLGLLHVDCPTGKGWL